MSATLVSSNENSFTIQLKFNYSKSMLEGEKYILETINQAGSMASGKLLEQFDTDGSPIKIGNQVFTTKGQFEKNYQTPYGTTRVSRHVYQSHTGGKTYCPLETDARIIITSTPKFAQMISSKYSQMSVRSVVNDLTNNHGRAVQNKIIQDVSEAVGAVITAKEEKWTYNIPKLDDAVKGISIGLDGACMLMKDDGWRTAMTGTISLYNKYGDNIHTRYVAAPPEYGKETFLNKFEKQIDSVKQQYPDVTSIGLADGAHDNWSFLNQHTDYQLLDFYHASEYVGDVGKVFIPDNNEQRDKWIENECHKLKNNVGGAARFLTTMNEIGKDLTKKDDKTILKTAITYFKNNTEEDRMQYYKYADSVLPIGSGATEAACKVIIKQRMCQSGMRWRNDGAQIVLVTRALHETAGSWDQFWGKVDKYGFNGL